MSRWQPHGVHGPSRVVDPRAFRWSDHGFAAGPLEQTVLYEVHVGTFTPEGTFAAIIPRLPQLRELGVTALELMPVAEFPGGRNWGYDGVHLFAPQSSYGGPEALRALIDACHGHGLAVILDVVYNHLGPEGNYLGEFAPCFTHRYATPWGPALNFDGADSDGVRRHVLSNARMWVDEFHCDGLRLDAIHYIFDSSPRHLFEELQQAVHAPPRPRPVRLIAESDFNDVRVLRSQRFGGYGLDAQWNDDLHHALRAALGERRGYFADFGRVDQLARALTHSFVYDGQYSSYRRRRHGTSAEGYPGRQFVVYAQNHDQVANGTQGRRLAGALGPAAQAMAAALVLTSPNVPMLFMGEEYGELAPFVYFVSHGDPSLIAAVREGRRRDLGDLAAGPELASSGGPDAAKLVAALVDPQAEAAFLLCKLDWARRTAPEHAAMLSWYRELIALRRRAPALHNGRKDLVRVWSSEADGWLIMERADPSGQLAVVACNLRATATTARWTGELGSYRLALANDDQPPGDQTMPPGMLCADEMSTLTLELPGYAARIYLSVEAT